MPEENRQKDGTISVPRISLPKGGGAIRGIEEKYSVNPVTGSASFSIPIFTSPGRQDFFPKLSLSYDSGAGNGPFGFGWSLSLPSITRKTEKGLPHYRDAEESDVFILSGAEDLVPVLAPDGDALKVPDRTMTVNGREITFRITRYRPRIEGLFARIERWTNKTDPKDVFWRSISKDNITTWYGRTDASRIADPSAPERIFSWLICENRDDRGNIIAYEYLPEDSAQIDLTQANERNRDDRSRSANRYLKRVKYGNKTPRQQDFLFEVVLDYGEHDQDLDAANDEGHPRQWECRPDPFSSYRAGFEVRTYRLCRRVMMFHRFDELGKNPCLVRTTDLGYAFNWISCYSYLISATQTGYVWDQDHYRTKSLPLIEFTYSIAEMQNEVKTLDAESLENLPQGIDGRVYQWVDLEGEGISGVLTEQAGAWHYKPNKGGGRFGALETVARKPSLAALGGGRQQLMDLAGDGQLDLVQLEGPPAGFYERTHEQGWGRFTPFERLPNVAWDDPNLRFVDLTGDGHADILVAEDDVLTWYHSLGEEGFGAAERVRQALDEEKGPRLVFADGTQSIYLADMSGDGLTDIARIRNGEVCYWPNLGYGRFGPKITMDNAPYFDGPDQFNQARIRLADIDGTGTTDIIYLGREGVTCWLNRSGNGWSSAQDIPVFPRTDNLSSIMVTDLLGKGTACLVWSSPLPRDLREPIRYLDLMGEKPHLLKTVVNNMGKETRLQYAQSTKFYLEDKAAGNPWVTKLPFPVHVVEKVETYDWISRNRFVTRYAYHHGYYDGIEREFRGFGMVEQWDTEEFSSLAPSGGEGWPAPVVAEPHSGGEGVFATNIDASSHVPPVLTRTWFHTGISEETEEVSRHFAAEYYGAPEKTDPGYDVAFDAFFQTLLPDTVLPSDLTLFEEREACRALKGSMLRQEVYALDGTDKEQHPYTVTEQNFTIDRLQPKAQNQHGVFFPHAREAISYHYERNAADPRISHTMTLEIDTYGNVLKSIAIGYGRGQGQSPLQGDDKKKQEQILVTYTENGVTNAIDAQVDDPTYDPDNYRTPLACEARTYEITGFVPADDAVRFGFDDFARNSAQPLRTLPSVPYEIPVVYAIRRKRLIERVRTLYRGNDLTSLLPLGRLDSQALPGEAYKLAFTPGLLTQVFQRRIDGQSPENLLQDPADVLGNPGPDKGGYVDLDGDGHWWIPSGRVFYTVDADISDPAATAAQELSEANQHFFVPRMYIDPFGQSTTVDYDAHDLLIRETCDAVGNSITADNDYRVLQPRIVTDPNRNRVEAAFDTLGMVAGTAVMGKVEENLGDRLNDFDADPAQSPVDLFFDAEDPHLPAPDLLKGATTRIVYGLDRFLRTRQTHPEDPEQWLPVYAATVARETHVSDPLPADGLKIQVSFSYSDGFGREIQKKIQAEPGPLVEDGPEVSPRWVGSGWTIFNNKGKPVRQYEPFFSNTHHFEFARTAGVSPILFYDPVERVVATLHPNHAYEKVVFDPWQQKTWDVNDTVLLDPASDDDVKGFFLRLPEADYLPTWYENRVSGDVGSSEQTAAQKTAVHAATPTLAHLDTLGRAFLTEAHNRFERDGAIVEERYATRINIDIEGNQREVIDARDRIVMRYDYSIAGPERDEYGAPTSANRIHQASMEAGERWMLNDVIGKPIRAWDSRGHTFRMEYDSLRRPVKSYVIGADKENPAKEILSEQTIYGEDQGNARNHRGKVYQVYDGAGLVTSEAYDFKGNLLSSTQKLALNYKATPDWKENPSFEQETFCSSTQYDAFNRPTQMVAPHSDRPDAKLNTIHPIYNEANLLARIEINLQGSETKTTFVSDIDYNAKGQREYIRYGNGVETRYAYDPLTFRLMNLQTLRDTERFQDLYYTYDPSGNITSIRDEAQQTVYFNNQVVNAHNDYTYDAVYRLIAAAGREHIGQTAQPQTTWDDEFRVNLLHPQDGQAMRRYVEQYEYDQVGNFMRLFHHAENGNWTRGYVYGEHSLIEPDKMSNRLSSTIVGSGPSESYTHDSHGNMTSMPHLSLMQWDHGDQLQQVGLGGGGTAYYGYDATGQRARKVREKAAGLIEERIYLGGFEVFRKRNGTGSVTLERETLHIMDDKQRIALVETRTQGNEPGVPQQLIRYQLSNHLGSASLELNELGEIISYEEYYPYGSTSYQAVRSDIEVPLKRHRYTGKERDEESGLYYHGARYYTPWLGRWVSCDPIGIRGAINLYEYCENSPLLLADLSGTQGKPTQEEFKKMKKFEWKPIKVFNWPGEVAPLLEPSEIARIAPRVFAAVAATMPSDLKYFLMTEQQVSQLPETRERQAAGKAHDFFKRKLKEWVSTGRMTVGHVPQASVPDSFEALCKSLKVATGVLITYYKIAAPVMWFTSGVEMLAVGNVSEASKRTLELLFKALAVEIAEHAVGIGEQRLKRLRTFEASPVAQVEVQLEKNFDKILEFLEQKEFFEKLIRKVAEKLY